MSAVRGESIWERPFLRRSFWIWIAALVALLAAGFFAWIRQLQEGLAVTDMRNVVNWGLYIVLFMYFVGLSAGGLIIASAGTIFGIEQLKPLKRVAILISLASIAVAGLFIIPDLGRPERAWHLFRYPQWGSPLIWDIVIVLAYGAMSLVYLWLHCRADLARRGSWLALGYRDLSARAVERDERIGNGMAYVALPAAVGLHSITAWVFGLQVSKSFWYTGILAPFFISSALVSGLGLFIVVVLVLRQLDIMSVPRQTISWLGGLLAVFILVDLFLLGAELLTRGYQGGPDAADPVNTLFTGRAAGLFWAELGLAVVAFGLLSNARLRKRIVLVGVAAAMATIGIFFKRLAMVLVGFYEPIVRQAPGTSLGDFEEGVSSFVRLGLYYPTWVEYLIVFGLIALGALLITLGVRLLPLGAGEEETV